MGCSTMVGITTVQIVIPIPGLNCAPPVLQSQSEGREWGVGSVVVDFGRFWGAPIINPEPPKHLF